jgi:hypothetical protein
MDQMNPAIWEWVSVETVVIIVFLAPKSMDRLLPALWQHDVFVPPDVGAGKPEIFNPVAHRGHGDGRHAHFDVFEIEDAGHPAIDKATAVVKSGFPGVDDHEMGDLDVVAEQIFAESFEDGFQDRFFDKLAVAQKRVILSQVGEEIIVYGAEVVFSRQFGFQGVQTVFESVHGRPCFC